MKKHSPDVLKEISKFYFKKLFDIIVTQVSEKPPSVYRLICTNKTIIVKYCLCLLLVSKQNDLLPCDWSSLQLIAVRLD